MSDFLSLDAQKKSIYSGKENLEVMRDAVRYNHFLETLVRAAAPEDLAAARVVDFGAGIGSFCHVLAGDCGRFIAVEADREQAADLARRGFAVSTMSDLEDGSVDYIYSLNVLEHIEDDSGTLHVIARKLRPGGHLLIYVPAFQMLWTGMDDLVGHCRRYRRRALANLMRSAGLDLRRCEYADSAGFFATLLLKLLGGGRSGRIGRTPLILFDRLAFPVGRLLDRAGCRLVCGKNLFAIGVRPKTAQQTRFDA